MNNDNDKKTRSVSVNMKKRLFVLVAMATLILGFSSCDININFTPSKANFYLKNDTDEDIDFILSKVIEKIGE